MLFLETHHDKVGPPEFNILIPRWIDFHGFVKEMRRLGALIDEKNTTMYHPQGLHILWPRNVAFMFVSAMMCITFLSAQKFPVISWKSNTMYVLATCARSLVFFDMTIYSKSAIPYVHYFLTFVL